MSPIITPKIKRRNAAVAANFFKDWPKEEKPEDNLNQDEEIRNYLKNLPLPRYCKEPS